MAMLWTAAETAAATGGRVMGDWSASGVSIDTRTLIPGDLFVALTAARDGHDFVTQALAKGAAAAMVSRVPDGISPDAPLLIVDDVLAGLTALGAAARARTAARVVAVTGSVGKTSTKEMLRLVLARLGRVHAAEASYNNHWGVPLTLARMPRNADVAVIEIGMNHRAEIAPLSRLARPHVALITMIAPAHLEALGTIEAIAEEKAEIFRGLEPGGFAVVPAGLGTTPILIAGAQAADARIVTFGPAGDAPEGLPADWTLGEVALTGDVTVAHAVATGAPLLYKVRAPGRHVALNALGALAVADALGADRALAAVDVATWVPPEGRGARVRVLLDPIDDASGFDLFDDAFNASPVSLSAALDVLAASVPQDGIGRVSRGRRVAVLGDMLELGPQAKAIHRDLARHPALGNVDRVHCVGPLMRHLWDALPAQKRGEWVATAPELAIQARRLADPGDVVLVKGSKGSKVSLVVDALRKLGHVAPPGVAAEASVFGVLPIHVDPGPEIGAEHETTGQKRGTGSAKRDSGGEDMKTARDAGTAGDT